MENPNLRAFGFTYEHKGRPHYFDIVADSQREAESCFASMTGAKCIGKIKELERKD